LIKRWGLKRKEVKWRFLSEGSRGMETGTLSKVK
jgi:hypothetical protein